MSARRRRGARRARAQAWARAAVATAIGLLAAAVGAWAAGLLLDPLGIGGAVAGLCLHAVAAGLAITAAAVAGATPCERDLVAVLGLCLPLCGPAMSWWIAVGRAFDARNAHAAFEAEARIEFEERRIEAERELRVVSHAQVLRHGSLEEKRNLLHRLARIGSPRYLALVRQFLRDDEPELRLCAYAELARLAEQREEEIAGLRAAAEALDHGDSEASAVAWAELALANFRYATSGMLDPEMAAYWLERSLRIGQHAIERDSSCRAGQRAVALACAELGDLDRALRVVAAWPEIVGEADETVRAEVAFRRRDRAACRASALRMQAAGWAIPTWLRTVIGGDPAAAPAAPAAVRAAAATVGAAADVGVGADMAGGGS